MNLRRPPRHLLLHVSSPLCIWKPTPPLQSSKQRSTIPLLKPPPPFLTPLDHQQLVAVLMTTTLFLFANYLLQKSMPRMHKAYDKKWSRNHGCASRLLLLISDNDEEKKAVVSTPPLDEDETTFSADLSYINSLYGTGFFKLRATSLMLWYMSLSSTSSAPSHLFEVDLYVLPVHDPDVLLGVQWLQMVSTFEKHNILITESRRRAYTKPLLTDYVAISLGQTLDLLLEANQTPSHYYMGARIYASGEEIHSVTIPATGIIEYVGNYTPPPSPLLPSFPQVNDSVGFTNQLKSLGNNVDVPKEVDETFFYTLSMNIMACANSTRLLASVNNVSMLLPKSIDILQAYYRGINGVFTADFPDFPPTSFNYAYGTMSKEESGAEIRTAVRILEYNTTVEIVFQGTNLGDGVEHPMHLHGYSFYVVGSGLGNHGKIRDPPNYNLVDPPLMENIIVPKNGWTTITFKANNPGVWYMHCHLERHMSWGMGMVFIVKDGKLPHEKMLPPPPDMPSCGGEDSSPPLVFGTTTILGKKRYEVE
ncbi:hypothetical protein SASPL_113353 [Salvia splendens]|uniref:Laccase n=1 Tax=Salvia splendens TaxID=180675 RepID=A0A8X8XYS0_SALSN|nr:hypothetical protein SASPL_113353 [Salvia splendens]